MTRRCPLCVYFHKLDLLEKDMIKRIWPPLIKKKQYKCKRCYDNYLSELLRKPVLSLTTP